MLLAKFDMTVLKEIVTFVFRFVSATSVNAMLRQPRQNATTNCSILRKVSPKSPSRRNGIAKIEMAMLPRIDINNSPNAVNRSVFPNSKPLSSSLLIEAPTILKDFNLMSSYFMQCNFVLSFMLFYSSLNYILIDTHKHYEAIYVTNDYYCNCAD